MRVSLVSLIIIIILSGIALAGASDPYNYPIVKLYENATTYSKEIYRIPIEVRLLDVNENFTWFKVNIRFFNFDFAGWTPIPVGGIIAERSKKENLAGRLP